MRGHEGGWHRNPSAPRCLPREACASFYPGLKALGNNSGAGSRGRKRAEGWRMPPSPALRWVGCAGEAHRDPAGCVWPLGKAAGLQPPCLQPWGSGRGLRAAPSSSCWEGIGENTGPGRGEAPTGLPVAAGQHTEGWVVLGVPHLNGPKGVTGGAQSGTALFGVFSSLLGHGLWPLLVLLSLLGHQFWCSHPF